MAAVGTEAVTYLARELARRAEYQHPAGPGRRPPRLDEQPMQQRQRERGGLAGAGLGDSDHVATRQGNRDGLQLYGCGRDVFVLDQRAPDRLGEPQIMKRGQ